MKFKDFKFDLKAEEEGVFRGLAAVYGNTDLGGDVIEPGAFTRTIKNSGGQVPVLWQHNVMQPIGTASLEDTKRGLAVEGNLVMESTQAREAFALMKAGVVKGLSIGFDVVKKSVDDEKNTRHLTELKLWEVSPVTFPMNPRAQITGVKAWISEMREFLDELKEQPLGDADRKSLEELLEKAQALLEADSAKGHSAAAPAKQYISAPDLHALTSHLKEICNHA